MATSRVQIKFGVPFTVSVGNAREQEFEVLNFHDAPFDFVLCKITNTTSETPPEVYVTDQLNGIIKAKFSAQTSIGANLEMIIQGGVAQKNIIEEKKVLFSDEKLEAVKQAPKVGLLASLRMIKYLVLSFVVGSLFLYALRNTNLGQALTNFNAAKGAKVLENFDHRIHTNKHPIYKTADFVALNAEYKREFGDDQDLERLYNFVGDVKVQNGVVTGMFILKDLARDQKGLPVLATWFDADKHCEKMGGILLSSNELKTYLADQYIGVDNFLWPIQRRSNTREWTADQHSSIPFFKTFWMFLKRDPTNPSQKQPQNGFVIASGKEKAAFRCGFSENFYIAAK